MFGNITEVPTYTKRNIIGDRTQIYEKDVKKKNGAPNMSRKRKNLNSLKALETLEALATIPAEAYDKCMENMIKHCRVSIDSKRAQFEGVFLYFVLLYVVNKSIRQYKLMKHNMYA